MREAWRRAWASATAMVVLAWSCLAGASGAPAWNVRELVVTAHRDGPMLWRIQKGDSEVWALGVLPLMPVRQPWSTKLLERIMAHAHVLLIQPRWTASVGSTFTPYGPRLSKTLPPELYARLAAAAALAGQRPDHYERLKPVWAGLTLMDDYMHAADLGDGEPENTVMAIAHRYGVPVRSPAVVQQNDLFRDLDKLTKAQSQACLNDFIGNVVFLHDHAGAEAAAWARGDLGTIAANYATPALIDCFQPSQSWRSIQDQSTDDTVAAIDAALARPGTSVAIFPIDDLLREGGALERLRAEGATISTPDD